MDADISYMHIRRTKSNEINAEPLPWGMFILAFILFCLVVYVNSQATTGGKNEQGKLKAINNSM